MANATKLAASTPFRGILVGWPGAGKTGALACLVSAGFKVRYLDFDGGNYGPMLKYSDPKMHKNVDIISFADKLVNGARFIETAGLPTAFNDAMKMLIHWKYKDADGTEVDLGRSKDWGPDTIVVIDTLDGMGDTAFRRAQSMLNKTPLNTTRTVWGVAMADQENAVRILANPSNGYHLIILSHLTMVGPKDVEKDDDEVTKELKERAMDILPTRLYPAALGQKLPPKIGGAVPTLLLVERVVKGGKVKRVIRSDTGSELDTKIPSATDLGVLPIETGMIDIFNAVTPGVAACLAWKAPVGAKP